jgi:predicted nucleic acid-binding protein
MTVVVDASVAIRWSFRMDRSDRADTLMHSGEPLLAPDLILAEIAHVAWKFVVFEGRSAQLVAPLVHVAERAFDELVSSASLKDRALEIAIALKHPAYDCFYLALAEQRGCRMITADDRLVRRCAGSSFGPLVAVL